MINEKLEHLLFRVYFISITKMQTNGIMPLLVKNCSQPFDNMCDADCKTVRFDLGGQEGASIFVPAGWSGGWGRGNGAIC